MWKNERVLRETQAKKGTISVSESPLLFSLFASPVCGVGLENSTCGIGIADKGSNQSEFTWELLRHFIDWARQMFFCEGVLW